MRVTRKQAELNRQRIIDSAIRLFAERGVDAVGVAEVMGDAGFTHGGFYNHFTSKDDLVLEACSTSFSRSITSLRDSERPHRAQEADFGACLSAAMLCESSKGNSRMATLYAKGVSELLDVLGDKYGDDERAAAALSCFVGARVISRAVERADRDLSDRFSGVLEPYGDQSRVQASS
jgi:TetR/AcrR family transcriptional repressor of nem operon